MNKTRRQMFLGVLGVLPIVLLVGGIKGCQVFKMMSNPYTPPPEAVTSFIAEEQPWEQSISVTASLSAVEGVTISSEESGRIVKIAVQPGAKVNAGDLLVELDTSVETAELNGAIAELNRATSAANRSRMLVAKSAVAEEQKELTDSQSRKAQARVEELKARIAKKRIVAPFNGTSGIHIINVGQYVNAGTPLIPLYNLDSLYADFSVAQRFASRVRAGQEVRLILDAIQNQKFSAKILAVNPQLDETTRNMRVRAIVPNSETKLRPGMFAQAEIIFPESDRFVTVPASSISFAPFGDTLYLIDAPAANAKEAPRKIHQQVVKTGPRRGDLVAILEGIKAGDEVVSSGWFKLHPDALVIVNNSVLPSAEKAPQPADT